VTLRPRLNVGVRRDRADFYPCRPRRVPRAPCEASETLDTCERTVRRAIPSERTVLTGHRPEATAGNGGGVDPVTIVTLTMAIPNGSASCRYRAERFSRVPAVQRDEQGYMVYRSRYIGCGLFLRISVALR
jgi:hypothetical protein